MCGIFLLLNHSLDSSDSLDSTNQYNVVNNLFMKGRNRGPENSKLEIIDNNTIFGFHRLAINGLDDESNQPLCINDCILICNGEIYNYKNLYDIIKVDPSTNSDCEIIIHMYLKYGIDQTLIMLDGVFAFALYDTKKDLLMVARDPYGVRSLFFNAFNNLNNDNTKYYFASELKSLYNKNNDDVCFSYISQLEPGYVYKFDRNNDNNSWHLFHMKKYHICNFSYNLLNYNLTNKDMFLPNISKYLEIAVMKRCVTTERPVACLLSGGLDSSLISALVSREYFKKNGQKFLILIFSYA